MKIKKKVLLIVILLLILLGIAVDIVYSCSALTTHRYTYSTDKIQDNFRIVVLSDLHGRSFGKNNVRLAEAVIAEDPDIVIMAGDMLDSSDRDDTVPVELVRKITEGSDISVFYAFGNHEINFIEENPDIDLTGDLESAGATVLEMSSAEVRTGGTEIRIGGLYEFPFGSDGNDSSESAPDNVRGYLDEFEATDKLKILAAHRPDSFVFGDAAETRDIDLVISGHTHGGQIILPFLGGVYGGDQGFFPRYSAGMYKIGKLTMFITSGLGSGHKLFPRFNNPPEIAVIDICPQK